MPDQQRVIVAGATGKTGSAVTRSLLKAADIEIVGAVTATTTGDLGENLGVGHTGIEITHDLEPLLGTGNADVLVDFTTPNAAGRNALAAVERNVHPVVGTTAIPEKEVAELEEVCRRRSFGAAIIPNFSLGAMLLFRFAQQAAKIFDDVEIVEGHHKGKLDAPSGTAIQLRQRLDPEGTGEEIPTHSLRLPGLVADHEVVFGSMGETLSLKHRTVSRQAFGPGVLLAVRKVPELDKLVFELDALNE